MSSGQSQLQEAVENSHNCRDTFREVTHVVLHLNSEKQGLSVSPVTQMAEQDSHSPAVTAYHRRILVYTPNNVLLLRSSSRSCFSRLSTFAMDFSLTIATIKNVERKGIEPFDAGVNPTAGNHSPPHLVARPVGCRPSTSYWGAFILPLQQRALSRSVFFSAN